MGWIFVLIELTDGIKGCWQNKKWQNKILSDDPTKNDKIRYYHM